MGVLPVLPIMTSMHVMLLNLCRMVRLLLLPRLMRLLVRRMLVRLHDRILLRINPMCMITGNMLLRRVLHTIIMTLRLVLLRLVSS